MIKAVIFDMDGLLINSEPLWKITNEEVYGELGIKITPEIRSFMMGRRAIENARHLYELYNWKGPTPEEVVDRIVSKVIERVKTDGRLLPGVDNALQICKQKGLKVAIASSSDMKVIDAVVDYLEIREHFHHIYSAQFETYGKPHPGVFIKVAEHFEVSPDHCLVFEDSPSGVLAAKAAKMKCIAVPEPQYKDHKFVQAADLILDSLEEFDPEMLRMPNS